MCQMVIHPDGRWLGSARSIEAEPSWGVVFMDGDAPPDHREFAEQEGEDWRDWCLCSVDVEAALKRAGVRFTVEDDGFITVAGEDGE